MPQPSAGNARLPNDYAIYTGVAALIVAIAAIGERRRTKRANLEKVGFMPWPLITVIAAMVFVICAGLALHGG